MSALPHPPAPPAFELQRLKQTVKSRLFDEAPQTLQIGRFRVQEVLGQGGMGIVYRAVDDELGREVAIKLLRPELGPETEKGTPGHTGGARLAGEAKSLARLSHPNVVGVFDVGIHEGRRFIAMEFVEGQTLGSWLEHGGRNDDDAGRLLPPVGLAEVMEVFRQAGEGLAAAHSVGLVHRDFKPDNVLVGKDGRARVLDFGLARPPDPMVGRAPLPPALDGEADALATSLTRTGALLGTPAYMAPEQHLGEPADARSDQFAFCVALHMAVYGHRPFLGDDLRTLSLSIVAGRREPVSTAGPFGNVPPALAEVISRGISVDRNRRFDSMRELLEAMEAAMSGAPMPEAAAAAPAPAAANSTPRGAAAPDYALHTMDVERVLDHALNGVDEALDEVDAALGSGPSLSGRPALGPDDLQAVAREAGIDPEAADRAARQLVAARSQSQMEQAQTATATPAERKAFNVPPASYVSGMQASVTARHVIRSSFAPRDATAVARTLDRAFGERGECEFIGNTFVWSSSEVEATLAPSLNGTIVVLERNLTDIAVRRRKRYMRTLGALGAIFSLIISDIAGFHEGEGELALLLLFIYTLFGIGIGHVAPRRGHKKLVAQTRERLDWASQRLDAVLAAEHNDPRALEAAGA